MTPSPFEPGDRVRRRFRFPDETERLGTISSVYESIRDCANNFHWMYSVVWDDTGLVERGYMVHGLEKLSEEDLPSRSPETVIA